MLGKEMVNEKSWEEFRTSKMLWVANRTLHLFGWAICIEGIGENARAYPARVKFRGFDNKSESDGFIGVSKFLKENIEELLDEANQ